MHLELFSNVFSIEVKLNEFLSVNSLHNHIGFCFTLSGLILPVWRSLEQNLKARLSCISKHQVEVPVSQTSMCQTAQQEVKHEKQAHRNLRFHPAFTSTTTQLHFKRTFRYISTSASDIILLELIGNVNQT